MVLTPSKRAVARPNAAISPSERAASVPACQVSYGNWRDAWDGYPGVLRGLIRRFAVGSVCDIGGGANPALPIDDVTDLALDYLVLDRSAVELAKAPAGYAKWAADICDPALLPSRQFDLVISRMLLEHVADGERFHRNVLSLLRPGGVAFHFFPTLHCPPFVANRLLAEKWTSRLLAALAPRDAVRAAKFPAYYSWCRGPTRRQIGRLEGLGYRVIEYRGFFGHDYYARIPGLRNVQDAIARLLLLHPLPCFTSYAYLLVQKPSETRQ